MKIAVLGGYGLIGSASIKALKQSGHKVIGVGRSQRHAKRTDPDIEWIIADIATTSSTAWRDHLAGLDVVINASGLLQGGSELHAIHVDALQHLTEALTDTQTHLIQISATSVSDSANTAFIRTKAKGEAILTGSAISWTILRPTLVLAPQAYGGAALLRAAAAFPMIEPRIFSDTPMQSIHIDDLSAAVLACAEGRMPKRKIYDLTEEGHHRFANVVRKTRHWLGFANWRFSVPVPAIVARMTGWLADIAGWFGWRSAFRTTALKVMQTGVSGDPTRWIENGGAPIRSLDETLATLPSTTQERWFARLFLLIPVSILSLAVFWIGTGLITLANPVAATGVLTDRGMPLDLASISVYGGVVLDMLLGIFILFRRTARRASLGMAAISFVYMVLSTVTAPDLWLDPLGPFLKILPIIVLSLMLAAILEER